MAWRRYFFIKFGESIPILERKNESIGNSKINPAPRIILMIIEKYSSMEKLFDLDAEPNPAANFSVKGSIIKYAKTTPHKKHTVVNRTIH